MVLLVLLLQSHRQITEKQQLALGHSYSEVVQTAVKDFKRKYGAKFVAIPGDERKRRRLEPRLIWQQDGATAHWSAREMRLLEELGFSIEDGTILVEAIKKKWPARSPDMNWMDQFVWGVMSNELRYVDVRSRAGLIRAIKKNWRENLTLEFCEKAEGSRSFF